MYVNKFLMKKIGIGLCVLAVPAVAIGGYFAVSSSDMYRNYYTTPTNDSPRGYIDAYKKAVYNGAEVIAAPGFTHRVPILNAFSDSEHFFDNTGFMLYDDTTIPYPNEPLNKKAIQNTWSCTFRSDLGSIQAGIALGMFLNENQATFLENDGKLTYGLFGGLPFASVTSFMGGFQQGIEWFNKYATTIDSSYKQIEETSSSNDTYFSGNFSPSGGSDLILDYLSQKTDVIIPVAGPQVWLAQQLIITNKAKAVVLGVDSAVEDDPQAQPLSFKNPDGSQIGNGKYVQFSSVKNLARAGETALKIINNGNKKPDSDSDANRYLEFVDSSTGTGGFGTIAVGNIQNGCVGVSEAGQKYLKEALSKSHQQDPTTNYVSNQDNMAWKSPQYRKLTPDQISSQSKDFIKANYNNYYDGLQKNFENVMTNSAYDFGDAKPLNKAGFIQKDDQADSDKIKVILSGSTSILLDGSFSQSCYKGIVEYYATMGITLPYPGSIAQQASTYEIKRRD